MKGEKAGVARRGKSSRWEYACFFVPIRVLHMGIEYRQREARVCERI